MLHQLPWVLLFSRETASQRTGRGWLDYWTLAGLILAPALSLEDQQGELVLCFLHSQNLNLAALPRDGPCAPHLSWQGCSVLKNLFASHVMEAQRIEQVPDIIPP